MNDPTPLAWWSLHLRASRGETLTAEERAVYEAGLEQLHAAETLDDETNTIREERAKVQKLAAKQAQLSETRKRLENEIPALESALSVASG